MLPGKAGKKKKQKAPHRGYGSAYQKAPTRPAQEHPFRGKPERPEREMLKGTSYGRKMKPKKGLDGMLASVRGR